MTAKRHYIPWADTQPAPAESSTHYGMDDGTPELRIVGGLLAWVGGILLALALLSALLLALVHA